MGENWQAENFEFKKNINYENAGGGFVWINKEFLPDEIKKVEYGNLFAYMYRRFGIPQHGSDSHKEIANWYITTPKSNVALRVSPRPSGISHSFGYVINLGVYGDRFNEQQKSIVKKALVSAMSDLLTPVYVRDVPITAAGRTEDHETECDSWLWAGYGVPVEHFEEKFGE